MGGEQRKPGQTAIKAIPPEGNSVRIAAAGGRDRGGLLSKRRLFRRSLQLLFCTKTILKGKREGRRHSGMVRDSLGKGALSAGRAQTPLFSSGSGALSDAACLKTLSAKTTEETQKAHQSKDTKDKSGLSQSGDAGVVFVANS